MEGSKDLMGPTKVSTDMEAESNWNQGLECRQDATPFLCCFLHVGIHLPTHLLVQVIQQILMEDLLCQAKGVP